MRTFTGEDFQAVGNTKNKEEYLCILGFSEMDFKGVSSVKNKNKYACGACASYDNCTITYKVRPIYRPKPAPKEPEQTEPEPAKNHFVKIYFDNIMDDFKKLNGNQIKCFIYLSSKANFRKSDRLNHGKSFCKYSGIAEYLQMKPGKNSYDNIKKRLINPLIKSKLIQHFSRPEKTESGQFYQIYHFVILPMFSAHSTDNFILLPMAIIERLPELNQGEVKAFLWLCHKAYFGSSENLKGKTHLNYKQLAEFLQIKNPEKPDTVKNINRRFIKPLANKGFIEIKKDNYFISFMKN